MRALLSLSLGLGLASGALASTCIHNGKTFANCAAVEKYIANADCKANYISQNKLACVSQKGECFPVGTDATNDCHTISMWHWFDSKNPNSPANYAPGVNPHNAHRVTANGEDKRKTVWAYTMDVRQAEAVQVFAPEDRVTAEALLQTPVNHITFLANINVENATEWWVPGKNNTDGCGQKQTWELPFGFQGNSTKALPEFQQNLKKIHDAGVTITMTLGSWCTQIPITYDQRWTDGQFQQFVDYFEHIRETVFGGTLDGIDFDWEGYCKAECLKDVCSCDWDDKICGSLTPDELAAGHKYTVKDPYGGKDHVKMCWMLPTMHTVQVMTGITAAMKKAKYVVTLAPMSTAVYTGDWDKSPKQVMRNEFVKWRQQDVLGGSYNLLELVDGIMLQWYSGFDAALCENSDDPKACTCDNKPDADYANTITLKDGLLTSYFDIGINETGNMFPKEFNIRCQSCGKNVLLPNGTRGDVPCANKNETWFVPGANGTKANEHRYLLDQYVKEHDTIPYWWPEDYAVGSKCPRRIDCPDWRYEGEQPYASQVKLLQSMQNIVDLSKVCVGFEVLATDVLVQFEAYQDPALPWPTATKKEMWEEGIFNHNCTQNMTVDNVGEQRRCGQPLITQQWGLKFVADDVIGLSNALEQATGKALGGVGFFTVDGVLATPAGKPKRLWAEELVKLDKKWVNGPKEAEQMVYV